MKFLPLFLLLFFILLTHAQRRTTAKPSTDPETPKPTSRGRGRSRFISPDTKLTESSSTTEPSSRKTIVSRRRVVENVEQKFPSRASIVSSTPKIAPVNRKTASIGETADKIFLNDNIDRKLIRPANNLNIPLTESVGRKISTPVTQTERKNFRTLNKRPKNTYEVEEVINDDVDPFKRSKKPRVLTETNFRASKRTSDNADFSDSSSKNLVATEPLNALANTNLVEEQQLDTTLNPELEPSLDSLTEVEVREEVQKTVPVSSTAKPTEAPRPQGNRRVGLRRVVNRVPEQATPVTAAPTRIRTRNRATQAPDFYFQAVSTSVPSSSFRRRVDSLFSSIEPKKGPSVFNADAATSESRSRTGRKIELPPEKITLTIPTRSRRVTTTPKSVKNNSVPTFRSRGSRFRSREMPVIDEQKLEVLPLFEEEPKLVPTRSSRRNDNLDARTRGASNADVIRSRGTNRDESLKSTTNRADIDSRSRNRVSFREKQTEDVDLKARRRGALADNIETSATETDVKITKPNEISVSVNVETRTEPLKPSNHNTVKESVTSEINEVTSRRKVPRKKVTIINQTKRKVVPVFRGTKKSEVKLEKKQSSEEIGDSDNYPAEFKALLKAAKSDRKESRASLPSSSTLSSAIDVVTSTTSTAANLLTTRQINDNENEIKSKPSTPSSTTPRWSRSRYAPSTSTQSISVVSTTRRQFVRSTTSATPTSRETKQYLTFPSRSNNSIPRVEKNVSFKPRSFSNENGIKRFGRGRSTKRPIDSTSFSTKVPKYSSTVKKIDRGKYRSGSTTNAPKYIPTIPSAPYVPTVPIVISHRSGVGASTYQKDDDLGLQVISIDEPVYAIPSANLVNGDYNSSTANSVSVPLPLVNGGTTEKPVSIIERIINSITARSTTSPPTNTQISKITESTTESPSAILKLSQKKTRQTDKTDDTRQQTNLLDTVTLTTENPTTIIEKILSSLNAIQATDNTGSIQVGTDFNTLSSFTTTPLPSVTKSSTRSLLAHSSTSVNPLSILDEITPEEVLQKQTIGRLLDILNGLVLSTPQPSENLIVVTPKNVNKPPTLYYNSPLSSTIPTDSTFFSAIPNANEIISDAPFTSSIALSSDTSSTELSSTITSSSQTEFTSPISLSTEETTVDVTSSLAASETTTSLASSPSETTTETIRSEENSITTSLPTTTTTLSSDESLTTSSTTVEAEILSTESSTSFPSTSEIGINSTEAINFFTLVSTLPTLEKFEVSPGSVSVFSANDLSNSITPEDNFSTTTTVNIAGRFNYDNTATTQSTTTEGETTTLEVTTEALVSNSSGAMESSTPVIVNSTQTNDRSGKLLRFDQDPVQNSIDNSTPDYFIFAVLNNNTVLRKRPLVEPKAPFFVIGVYPNNTVVKKFSNGTVVPMESIIRVRGFDTRPNPPPLPEITSNQVTSESGSTVDNKIVETDDQNTIPSDTKPLSIAVSTTPSIPPKISKASSTAQSSSISVTTPTVTSSSKPDTMPTPSRPMSTILTSGRTVETSTEITSTITPNVNDASTTLSDMVTVASTTLGGNNNPTFPTLSELLNGNTLEAFNEIVNKTDNVNFDTPKSEEVKVKKVDSTTATPGILSTLNSSPTQSTTTENPSPKIETTTQDPAFLSNRILDDTSTNAPTTRPTKGRRLTSTPAIPTSTYFPTFLSTLFPNLFETTRSPIKSTRAPEGVIRISAAPSVTETISFAASTSSPTTIRLTTPAPRTTIVTTTARRVTTRPTSTSTTTARSTSTSTRRSTARRTTTTAAPTTTTTRRTTAAVRRTTTSTPPTTTTFRRTTAIPRSITTTTPPTTLETVTAASTTQKSITVTDFNTVEVTTPLKLKELTNEQRENLKMIARLEKEQAQLFQQLSFLTNLGIGPNKAQKPLNTANRNPKGPSKTLAERIVALAVERDKETTIESTVPTTTFRIPKSIQDQLDAIETTKQPKKATSLEDVLKQYNLNGLNVVTTPTNPTSKSEDAILNSLLKEQGIVPSTPKSLSGLFQETTIRPRPRARTTTPPPGPLMRGLNWLLTALAPQPQPVPTRRPTPKPVKPKKPPVDQELLANSPTHVTPVVTPAPSKVANAISQDDIQKLIKQLEGIQKNPSKESLDLSKIKSIQNLINLDEGVVVMTNGEHGTTSRRTSTLPTTSREPTQRQPRKLPTDPPLIVSVNSVEDFDLESTTTRVLRAPIGFRPVPGVDDNGNSLVRSNLITAAVNVTRAISGFLGTALQGAASSFSSLFGGGSSLGTRLLGNAAVGSSAG